MAYSTTFGSVLAASGMVCVGSSVAVSQALVDAPLFTVQAARYALAVVLLLALAFAARRPLPRPRGTDWAWLAGVSATGLVLFNVGVVRGVEHAEPAVIGIAVATVPLVLATAGPLLSRSRPVPALLVAAGIVTAGAALVHGGGRTDLAGVGWATLVLVTEAAFTLLAVPVLARLGPWAVSLHACWLAAVALAVLGVTIEGPHAITRLHPDDIAAAVHLAVVVTALAFVLWYSAVRGIGPGRAGLFTGVVPVTAAAGGTLLGGPAPSPVVWLGIAVVFVGLTLGLGSRADVPRPSGGERHQLALSHQRRIQAGTSSGSRVKTTHSISSRQASATSAHAPWTSARSQ
jgi:drug/metabolite transporter (DMT)-like permease